MSRILKRRTANMLEAKGLVTTSVLTPEDEEKEGDAWLACARSSLRAGSGCRQQQPVIAAYLC